MDTLRATRQQIADVFSVAGPTITRWFQAEGMPRNADQSYNLVKCIQWALERERNNATQPAGDEGEEWLTKYRMERALKAESERMETEGRLVDASEVEKIAFARGRQVTSAILNLPARLAPILANETDPKQITITLTSELKAALGALTECQ